MAVLIVVLAVVTQALFLMSFAPEVGLKNQNSEGGGRSVDLTHV